MPATVNISAQFNENQLSASLERAINNGLKGGLAKITGADPFASLTKNTRSFSSELDRANQRVITLGASFAVLSTSLKVFRDIVSSTVSVEKALVDINAVFNLTSKNLDQFSRDLFDAARLTSTSFDKAAEAAKEFSRQGLSTTEVIRRTTDALLLSRQSGLDVADSVKTITTSLNSFNREALNSTQIINKLANVDTQFAVSSKDLADSLTRVGSSASDAGVSFNQLIALVTTAKQISGRDGASIAQALNTIFTRVSRKGTLDDLEALGVQVRNARQEVLPTIDVLRNFAERYDQLGGAIKTQAAELVGGVRNLNTLKAVLSDLSRENGIYAQSLQVSANSTDQAISRNAALNQSFDSLLERTKLVGQQIGANIGKFGLGTAKDTLNSLLDSPITKAFANAGNDKDANTLGERAAAGFLSGFGNAVLTGIGPILVISLGKIIYETFRKVLADGLDLSGLNTAAKQQQVIQNQIVGLYNAGDDALKKQLLTMGTLAERAALVEGILAKIAYTNAAAVEGLGALGGAVAGRRFGRAAEGYIPMGAESAAISAGVGGAPANARPVFLPGFNRGGGQFGIVANTSEWQVPGAAGGAIYNRDMIRKYGLPPGAMPVAAGGFIPHAAGGGYNDPNYYKNLGYGGPSTGFPFGVAPGSVGNPYPGGVQGSAAGQGFGQYQSQIVNAALVEAVAKAEKILSSSVAPQKLAGDFEKGLKEIDKQNLTAERAAAKKIADLAKMEAILDKENALITKRATLTAAEMKLAEKYPAINQASADRIAAAQLRGSQARQAAEANLPDYKASPQTMEAFLRARDASAGHGDDYNDLLDRRVRRSQGSIAPQSFTPGTSIFDQYGPIGPNRPASLYSRLNGRLQNPGVGIGASLALGFAGGLVPEGESGTNRGVALGGTKGVLSGASAGLGVGSIFGGPLIGGVIGAAIGGLVGAITKLNKSFEELSAEADQTQKKLGEELNATLEVFRLRQQRNAALQRGDISTAQTLSDQESTVAAKVRRPAYRTLIANPNDPDGPSKATSINAPIANAEALASGAELNLGRTNPSGKALSILGNMAAIAYAGGPLVSGFSYFDKTEREPAIQSTLSVIQKLPKDRLMALSAATRSNPKLALGVVGHLAGLSGDRLRNFVENADPNLAIPSIQSAINTRLKQLALAPQAGGQLDPLGLTGRNQSLESLATGYRTQAESFSINSSANGQITGVRQQIGLNNPLLTDVGRLILEGQNNAQNIQSQTGSQRTSEFLSGKANLLETLKGVPIEQASINKIKGLNSLQDLQGFRESLGTLAGKKDFTNLGGDEGPFIKSLDAMIRSLSKLDETEKANLRVNSETNRLQLQELLFRKTLAGARTEDAGRLVNAGANLTTARNRNDSQDVIDEAERQKILAGFESSRRNGTLTQAQYDGAVAGTNAQYGLNARQRAYQGQLALPRDTAIGQGIQAADLSFSERELANKRALSVGLRRGDEEGSINALRTATSDDRLEKQFRLTNISEGELRAGRLAQRNETIRNSQFTNGSDIAAARYAVGQEKGLQGDSKGSFIDGFTAKFDGLKRDMHQFADVGAQVANSLESSFSNAFGSFVTGTMTAKNAFKSFAINIAADAAKAFASKGVQQLLGQLIGAYIGSSYSTPAASSSAATTASMENLSSGYNAKGGPIGYAGGGIVPTVLMGGEFVFPPSQAARLGKGRLGAINSGTMQRFAFGGMVRGGSGVKDDIFQPLAVGSYVVRKAMVEKYGADRLAAAGATTLSMGGSPEMDSLPTMFSMGGAADLSNTPAPTKLYFSDGGGVDMSTPMSVAQLGGSGGGTFNIGVTINDQSTTTTSSDDSKKGSKYDQQLGKTMIERMKQVALQTIQENQRVGGILRQPSASRVN